MSPHSAAHLRWGLKLFWPGVLGIAILTAVACTGKITREASATVLTLEGSARIEGPGTAPRIVEQRSALRKGETLRTNDNGTAALMLLPGALVQLGPASALTLEELTITKDGNATDEAMSRVILLRLVEGTVDLVVQFESELGKWSVESPNGLLSTTTPGTCRLEVDGDRTRVTCLRGLFSFASTGDLAAVGIERGCFQEWPSNELGAITVETDARAQDEVNELLDVERKLLELQRRERFSPFPWRRL